MKIRYKLNRKSTSRGWLAFCRRSYGRILKQIRQIKQSVQQEFTPALQGYETVLSLALNEAEALAWETAYPHLLFPTLAREKAAEVRRWAFRQRTIRRTGPSLALAA